MITEEIKSRLFEKQKKLRKLLHRAADIADRGEALVCLDPKPMTAKQWEKTEVLLKDMLKIATGECELIRAGKSRPPAR